MKAGNAAISGNTYFYAIIPKIAEDIKVNVIFAYKN
jgi:hypothetical protein